MYEASTCSGSGGPAGAGFSVGPLAASLPEPLAGSPAAASPSAAASSAVSPSALAGLSGAGRMVSGLAAAAS